jgi:hypothetical protein
MAAKHVALKVKGERCALAHRSRMRPILEGEVPLVDRSAGYCGGSRRKASFSDGADAEGLSVTVKAPSAASPTEALEASSFWFPASNHDFSVASGQLN